ncbi:MAG: hypothetical protein EA426_00485 [Spirochaetaceae bacterium]|nr:MAG: hypothetical protein EA426_00485 [Spirochaetaceae bacterium]
MKRRIQKSVYGLLEELDGFQYDAVGLDRVWDLLFPDANEQWQWVRVTNYVDTFYLFHVDGDAPSLEARPGGEVARMQPFGTSGEPAAGCDPDDAWEPLLESMRKRLQRVKRDWIRANREAVDGYPLDRRRGILSHALVRESLPGLYRIDRDLGPQACEAFIALVESGYFHRDVNVIVPALSAGDYFRYCKLAYIAGKGPDEEVDESMSGREMYRRFADGRHEGLLDIDEDSTGEFGDWIDGKHPKRSTGGHPWEIKRGGNTTHIDLAVYRPPGRADGFCIELIAPAIGRLAEAVRMLLAIHEQKLPIGIADPDAVRKRLLAQDNIGIVPRQESLHRAAHDFDKKRGVYDVMHYADLGRYKRRLTPFIAWDPLPLLVPKPDWSGPSVAVRRSLS